MRDKKVDAYVMFKSYYHTKIVEALNRRRSIGRSRTRDGIGLRINVLAPLRRPPAAL